MSEIKKGDLVMVVKPQPCCGNASRIGQIFCVAGISESVQCLYCKTEHDVICADTGDGFRFRFSRLKKIDPPTQGETREAYVNLKQPVRILA